MDLRPRHHALQALIFCKYIELKIILCFWYILMAMFAVSGLQINFDRIVQIFQRPAAIRTAITAFGM